MAEFQNLVDNVNSLEKRKSMSENFIISILGEIRGFVWDRDIPSATCPEYIEHHQDCVEILEFIDEKMEMFRGKTNKEVAEMLLSSYVTK